MALAALEDSRVRRLDPDRLGLARTVMIELVRAAGADAIVSGDADLLVLHRPRETVDPGSRESDGIIAPV